MAAWENDTRGDNVTNIPYTTIQFGWKIWFSVILSLPYKLLQRFSHATTAVLSCHVQNLVVISALELVWEPNDFVRELEVPYENCQWNKPLSTIDKSNGHRILRSWKTLNCQIGSTNIKLLWNFPWGLAALLVLRLLNFRVFKQIYDHLLWHHFLLN